MNYILEITSQAQIDINIHKNSGNRSIVLKIYTLLNELTEHPTTGTGKPELLKQNLTGYWSRRINKEHRLIYEVLNKKVIIYSAKGHYL